MPDHVDDLRRPTREELSNALARYFGEAAASLASAFDDELAELERDPVRLRHLRGVFGGNVRSHRGEAWKEECANATYPMGYLGFAMFVFAQKGLYRPLPHHPIEVMGAWRDVVTDIAWDLGEKNARIGDQQFERWYVERNVHQEGLGSAHIRFFGTQDASYRVNKVGVDELELFEQMKPLRLVRR